MILATYRKQVDLLLQILPYVAKENPDKHKLMNERLKEVLST